MSKAIGQSITLSRSEASFDPQTGFVTTETYEGTRNAILSKFDAMVLAGFRCTYSTDGSGKYTLVATQNSIQPSQATTDEVPVDRWELDAENYQESIWVSPKIARKACRIAYASSVADTIMTSESALDLRSQSSAIDNVIASVRRACEKALSGTTTTDSTNATVTLDGPLTQAEAYTYYFAALPTATQESGYTQSVMAAEIYRYLIKNQKSYETRRPVLIRTRTISTKYPQQFSMPASEKIYKTDTLISHYSIPRIIALRLPGYTLASPSNPEPTEVPTGYIWAWKERRWQSSIVVAQNKVEETTEWLYAAWSKLTYELATS